MPVMPFFPYRLYVVGVGESPSPVTSRISSALPCWELMSFFFATSLDSGVSVWPSWVASYLELLRWVRVFLYFQRKDEGKRFTESSSPLQITYPLCPRWRIGEISTLIWSRVPPRRNSHGDISPWFRWFCQFVSHLSAYAPSANCSWTFHPQCNPKR